MQVLAHLGYMLTPTIEFRKFTTALRALGATDAERAKQLGIPLRTFMDYKAGRLPGGIRRLCTRPALLRALADDAEFAQCRGSQTPRAATVLPERKE